MKTKLKEIIDWLFDSNRMKHYGLGAIYGVFADDTYCAIYGGVGVGGALEFKDYQHGGKPDWIDFLFTFAGVMTGYGVRKLFWSL